MLRSVGSPLPDRLHLLLGEIPSVAETELLLRLHGTAVRPPPSSPPRPHLLCPAKESSVLLHALVHVDDVRSRQELHRHRGRDDGSDAYKQRRVCG